MKWVKPIHRWEHDMTIAVFEMTFTSDTVESMQSMGYSLDEIFYSADIREFRPYF
jgi:hypothetical protein